MTLLSFGPAASGVAAVPEPVADADYHANGEPAAGIVELGELLFFDKLLSGNRNISCATCHHPSHATGDGLAVSIGEGGTGEGAARLPGEGLGGVSERIPRNAQPLFNLGAREFTVLFHDGRVEADPERSGWFLTPMGAALPAGLDSALAAQALFPLVSADEMAGQYGENPVADAVGLSQIRNAWSLLVKRVQGSRQYVDLFVESFEAVAGPADISIVHIGNAIAAFTAERWRADQSPFDAYLRGHRTALDAPAERGLALFYGQARCAQCHRGKFQTDHEFHAIGLPQTGPGKGHGFDGHEDIGREAVTADPRDRYRFRTPTLRNVAETGPWGHSGAVGSLEEMVRYHLQREPMRPARLLPTRGDLDARDFLVHDVAFRRTLIEARASLPAVSLDEGQIDDLLAFLTALTDPSSLAGKAPAQVPSGLPVGDD